MGPGGVRALYIMGENPMMSEPNLNHTRHQMEQLEFLVAQDLFINESGAFADVFLPAASWAEKDGTFTNTDRRVQRVRQALPAAARPAPTGRSSATWPSASKSAWACQQRLHWDYQHPSEILEEMGAAGAGICRGQIRAHRSGRPADPGLGRPPSRHPFLFAETFPRGRGKFHALEYSPSVEMPDEEYPFILTTGRVLEHWHGGTMTRHSALDWIAVSRSAPRAQPRRRRPPGNQPSSGVRVTSRRGSIVLRATVTHKTTMGVVFIPFHFVEAAANLLTIDALDPQAKIPEYKVCAVRVAPAREEELANPNAFVNRGRY